CQESGRFPQLAVLHGDGDEGGRADCAEHRRWRRAADRRAAARAGCSCTGASGCVNADDRAGGAGIAIAKASHRTGGTNGGTLAVTRGRMSNVVTLSVVLLSTTMSSASPPATRPVSFR